MPVYKIRGPDGKLYRYKVDAKGADPDQVLESFNQQFALRSALRSIYEPPKEKAGFLGSFKEAVTSLGLTDEAAAFAANPTEENRQEFLKAAESKYKSVGGFGKGENWEAFKELLGGSLGALVAPIGAAVVGGGLPGFAGASAAQYSIANLQRQAEAQQAAAEAGEPVPDVNLGKAAIAAATQAGLDVVPGALILKGLNKFPIAQRLLAGDKTSSKAADIIIDALKNNNLSRTGSIAKGVGLGVAFEVPQEVAQQALERWQAGLPLDDEEAREEFKQAAIGAALLGGGFGAIGGYGTYRGEQARKAAERAKETAVQPPPPAPPEEPEVQPPPPAPPEEPEEPEVEPTAVSDEDADIEADREAELERLRQAEQEDLLTPAPEFQSPYSAQTLREAAEAEALAPSEEEETPYMPPARVEQPEVAAEEPEVEPTAVSDEDADIEAQRQAGLEQLRQAESIADVTEEPAAPPPAAPVPDIRTVAIETLKVTPTIKAVAEATGLNQPQAAMLVKSLVKEGIVERKGSKFKYVTPERALEVAEAEDVSDRATATEADRGAGGRGAELLTLGPPAGELGAPPVTGAGLGAPSDVTERVDDREGTVSPALGTDRAKDLRNRALDFIRQTGEGSAPALQKELGITLREAKILRDALLGSGAVVQKSNVKAAKTAGRSYFVVEGTYTPSGQFVPRETVEPAVDEEQKAVIEEAQQKATGRLLGEGEESETERAQREADKMAEITAALPQKLPPTLKPEIGKGEYGLRYTDKQGNPVYRAYESTGERNEARANLAKEGNKDFSTFSRMAEAAKFELGYLKSISTPAMTKAQVERAVRGVRAGMSKLKTQLGLFTEEEAPTPKKTPPARVTPRQVMDYAKRVISLARDSGKLKKYSKKIDAVLTAVKDRNADLRKEYGTLQRIEQSILRSEAEFGEAEQARFDVDEFGGTEQAGLDEDEEVGVKGRDEDEYKPLDFRKVRFKKKNPQIFTDKFKSWFGKSKIVDDVGDAATWYTGSPVTDIEAFRIGAADAIYASPEPNVANQFTFNRETLGEGVVYPVFIRAENPFDFANPTHVENLFKKMLENAGGNTGFISSILNLRRRIEEGAWQELEMPVVQRAIKALGHDGFYVYENRAKNIGVYDPNQIKSALGNTGAFSQYDPRIRFSKKKSQIKGMQLDAVRTLVSRVTAGWKNPPNFTVVQSYLDLPEGLNVEENADSMGLAYGNDVYIIADNIRYPSDLKAVVFHESLGHYGLEQLFGERLLKTMLDIYRTNKWIQADADAWLNENPDVYPESEFTQDERRALATEEVFAEMSEAGPITDPKLRAVFNRVAALIRKFARALAQIVGKDISYSNREIQDIIAQAHNMVISGKTRMVPRYNNIRYMKTWYNKVLKDAAARVQSRAPSATQELLRGNVQALSELPNPLRNFKLASLSMHHVMQMFERYAPAYKALNNLTERKAYDATKDMVAFTEQAGKYREVLRRNEQYVDQFNKLSHFINLTQTPVFEERFNANGDFVKFVPNVAAQAMRNIPLNSAAYTALSPEDKALHEAVNKFYALPPDVQQLTLDIFTDYRNYSEEAFKVKLNQLVNRLPAAVIAGIKKNFKDNRLKFYLPLPREGLYKLAYTNQQGVREVEFFQSLAERDAAEETARANGMNIIQGEFKLLQQRNYREGASTLPPGLLSDLLKNVEESLQKSGSSQVGIELAKETVFNTFIDFMPGAYGNDLRQEISSRRTYKLNGITYYGRLGFNEDVIGTYEKRIPTMIYQINNLKYTIPFEKVRKLINDQLITYRNNKGASAYAGLGDLDDNYIRSLQDDLDERVTFAKSLQQYSPYVYAISKANYIYSIALNVSSALINTTIIPMMAWPSLAAKYGPVNAARAIGQAMQLYFRHSFRDPRTGRIDFSYKRLAEMPTSFGGANMPSNYAQTAHGKEFARFHRAMLARSVVGTAAEQELDQAQNITVPGYEGLSAKTNLLMSYVFRSSERFNREVTSLASYMLARNLDINGQAIDPNRQATAVGKAIEEAIRLNYDINGATTPETNSRLYQSDIGRIVLTFRTHALNMILNLAFTFNQAIETVNANQPNAAERKLLIDMARKKLLYIFGSTYMLAGIKGLPVFGAAEVLASLLMGDDDEPYDLEQEVLDAVGTLGLNGPINELLNIDIASRTGFYGLIWRDDPKRLAEVGVPVYVLERMAGPTYGLVEAARRGFNDIAEGELGRGMEALTPAPIRNTIKGMRYAIDGALTRDGLPIVEDVNTYNSVMQILGFAPADLAVAQAQRGATYEISQKIKNRRIALLTNLYAARKAENPEAMEKALNDIRAYNEANSSYRITGDSIRKSYSERERRAREAIMGIYQPRNLRLATSQYVADLNEEDEDAFF